jgi:hypothetical protein
MVFRCIRAADVVRVVHALVVLFVVATPLLASDRMVLLFHALVCVSLMLHWRLNDDTCVLTLLECRLRGVDRKESFMQRLVSPIYKPGGVYFEKELPYHALAVLTAASLAKSIYV